MPTRAVLFDLGNTLVGYYRSGEFRPILRRCLHNVTTALGVTITAAGQEELFEHALQLNRESEDFSVRPLAERLRLLFSAHAEFDDSRAHDLCRHFMDPIFACAKPDDAALSVLAALRGRGIKTAIVSNTPWGSPAQLWREELARHALGGATDAAIFCMDVGWRKAHPAPMRLALERLLMSYDEAIFVGADTRWYIEGAKRAGIRSVLLSRDGASCADAFAVIDRLDGILEIVG